MLSVHSHLLPDFRYGNCMVVTKLKLTVGSLLFSLYNLLLSSINYAWHVQSLVQNDKQNTGILWYKLMLVPLLPGQIFPPASASVASALKY